jgi:hypothetical protein
MDVSYEARYEQGGRPTLCKVVSTGTEEVVTVLLVNNTSETENLSDDLIWQHMNNLVEFIKVSSQDISLVPQGVQPSDGWPLLGWPTISRAQEELIAWWVFCTYRDEPVEVIHNLYV